MALRRMFRRPKPVKLDDQVIDITDPVPRRPGPRQQWSRRPPEVAVVAAQEPAWAPASWRVGTDDPAAGHTGRDRAAAARVDRNDAMAAHTGKDDLVAAAAREIDRMAEEIRSADAPEEVELSVLQDHTRRVEMLMGNPLLRKLK
jgi:hypothetical protein